MSKIQNTKGRYVIWHNEMDGKYLTTEDQTQAYQSGYDSGYTYGVATSFDSGYTSGFTVGYESGFTDGEESGFTVGYSSGYTDGENAGFATGYQSGFTDGTESGYTSGYTSGFTAGYDSGYTDGVAVSFESGYTSGYTVGFASGYTIGEMDYFYLESNNGYATVQMTKWGNPPSVSLEYSFDKINWTGWDLTAITLNQNNKRVYFRGDNPNGFSSSLADFRGFHIVGDVTMGGDIRSLINKAVTGDTVPVSYCFNRFVSYCNNLSVSPNLLSGYKNLTPYCYYGMFYQVNLKNTPELPAKTLQPYCYASMFQSTFIEKSPSLEAPILVEGCYKDMFYDATNLCYIKCMARDISAANCTDEWLDYDEYATRQNGVFVKYYQTDWSGKTGIDGIPYGWNVVNEY